MTKAEALRVLVASLADDDDDPKDPAEIAAILGIPVARVDAILDALDPPHGLTVAPAIEPLERTPKTRGKLLTRAKPAPKAKRVAAKDAQPRDTEGRFAARVIECGTLPGYYQHRRRKEPPCRPCRDAYVADDRVKRQRKRPPIECGTYRGYKKHRREGEQPCRPCYDAYNEANRKWKSSGRPRQPINHGTPAGYRTHNRRNEPPCDECRDAYNEDRNRRERERHKTREAS